MFKKLVKKLFKNFICPHCHKKSNPKTALYNIKICGKNYRVVCEKCAKDEAAKCEI